MTFFNPHLAHAAQKVLHELTAFTPRLINATQHGTVIRIDDLDFAKILPNNRYRTPVATVQHVASPPDESLFDRLYSTLNVARNDIRRLLHYGKTPADEKHLMEMLDGWADYTERRKYADLLHLHDAPNLAELSRAQYDRYVHTPFAHYRIDQDVLLVEFNHTWWTIGAIKDDYLYSVLGTTPILHDAISTWFEQLDNYAKSIQKWETSYAKRRMSEPRALFLDFRLLKQRTSELKRFTEPRKPHRYTQTQLMNRLRLNERELENASTSPSTDAGASYDRFYGDLATESLYKQMTAALADPCHAMNQTDPVAPRHVHVTNDDDILVDIGGTQHTYGWIVRGLSTVDRFVRPFERTVGLRPDAHVSFEEQIATDMNNELRQLRVLIERAVRDYTNDPYSEETRRDVVRAMRTFAAVADYRFEA